MKLHRSLPVLPLLAALAGSGFALAPLPAGADTVIIIRDAPPPPRYERRPGARPGHVWVPGHWGWYRDHHVWRAGHWVKARPHRHYVEPAWVHTPRGWRYEPGYWRR